MLIAFIGFLIELTVPSHLSAQDISGTWHGQLSLPAGSLTIVFHIKHTEQGTYMTTLDSPDQGTKDIKTETTSFQPNHYRHIHTRNAPPIESDEKRV